MDNHQVKTCTKCKATKSVMFFHREIKGYKSRCKDCVNALAKEKARLNKGIKKVKADGKNKSRYKVDPRDFLQL